MLRNVILFFVFFFILLFKMSSVYEVHKTISGGDGIFHRSFKRSLYLVLICLELIVLKKMRRKIVL